MRIVLFIVAIATFGQAASLTWTAPAGNITAGQVVQIPVTATGVGVAAQATITAPVDVASMTVTSNVATKNANCSTFTAQKIICLFINQTNSTAIPDGLLFTVTATFKPVLTLTNQTFAITLPYAASPPPTVAIPVTAPSNLVLVSPPPISKCDLNADGAVNGLDNDIIISIIKGTGTAPAGSRPDHSGDGVVNVVDAQISIFVQLAQMTCP